MEVRPVWFVRPDEDLLTDLKGEGFANPLLFRTCAQLWVDRPVSVDGSVSTVLGSPPANLPEGDISTMDFGTGDGSKAKAWRDIWGSGQGIGQITDAPPVSALVERLTAEFLAAGESFASRARA